VDLWLFDLATKGASRFTFDPAEEVTPAWSRDGTTIAYRSISHAIPNVQLKKASGLEPEKSLPGVGDVGWDIVPTSWAPGDQEILCVLQNPKANDDLILQPVAGGKPRTFLRGSGNTSNGQISPDGKWVVYTSNETGDWEIYVTTFPGANGKWQVSRGGGTEPRWRGDGKAIFFLAPKGVLTETDVATEGTFATTGERPLFPIRPRPPISSTDIFTYDVARDGQRFLVNQYIKPDQIPPLSIILNEGGAAPE
jgi:Tol biopolymer transport system component